MALPEALQRRQQSGGESTPSGKKPGTKDSAGSSKQEETTSDLPTQSSDSSNVKPKSAKKPTGGTSEKPVKDGASTSSTEKPKKSSKSAKPKKTESSSEPSKDQDGNGSQSSSQTEPKLSSGKKGSKKAKPSGDSRKKSPGKSSKKATTQKLKSKQQTDAEVLAFVSEVVAKTPNSEVLEVINVPTLTRGLPEEFDNLTMKQKYFVVLYAHTQNGVQSARQAGYSGDDGSLRVEASRLLTNANIIEAMTAYTRPFFESQGITLGRVLAELADMAFAPWTNYIEVREKKGRIVGVKMSLDTKSRNLIELAKMLGAYRGAGVEGGFTQENHLHLNFNKNMSAEEARRNLLEFLRNN